MKKKAILGIITLCTVLFAGCGNGDVEAVGENISKENGYASEIETVVSKTLEEVIEESVVVNGFKMVKHALVDLDGDGIHDEVSFIGDELHVNNCVASLNDVAWEFTFTGCFSIVDYDEKDSFLEIIIPAEEREDWVIFYRLKDGELYLLGRLNENYESENFRIPGDGKIYGVERMDVHERSGVYGEYIIDENDEIVFLESEEDYLYVNYEEHVCTLMEELPLYERKDRDSKVTIIKPQNVRFRSTDGKKWVEVVAEDGTSGWMYVGEYYTITDCGNKDVTEVFQGTGYSG